MDEQMSCARCQRPVWLRQRPAGLKRQWRGTVVAATRLWPEGYVCTGCFAKACEIYGRCPRCDTERLLPGLVDGSNICADCAGLPVNFRCQRCGQEGWMERRNTCGRCVLGDLLDQLLDDGTGRVRPELLPFRDKVCAMPRPRSGIVWLNKPHVPPILRALARGDVTLTHDGLATLTPWRSVIYVRDLLISSGVLPPVDRFLLLFEQWLRQWLDTVTDEEHHKILRRFATWHVLRHLRAVAEAGPIGPYRNNISRGHMRQAAAFLADLAGRGLALADLNQAQLDHWHAAASAVEKEMLRPFLIWLTNRRRSLRLRLPQVVRAAATPVDQRQRLALIQRVHNDHTIEPADRLVALLILLYAQPLPRIVRLTVDDVHRDNDQVLLRLGDPPAPMPAPFDQVLIDYLAARPNRTTATNAASSWLFPGRRADQPIHPTSLRLRMNTLGIPVLNGRTAAIRHMLQEAPASVVAGMLGYQTTSAENIAAAAGVRWQRYAADRTSKP
jgi:hypothetical protein